MQNNFEKQVQEKLDELKFAPTAPVWENIEKQIRTKKERRRLAFWLPVWLLLLGGGSWWWINGVQKPGSIADLPQKPVLSKEHSPSGKKVQHTADEGQQAIEKSKEFIMAGTEKGRTVQKASPGSERPGAIQFLSTRSKNQKTPSAILAPSRTNTEKEALTVHAQTQTGSSETGVENRQETAQPVIRGQERAALLQKQEEAGKTTPASKIADAGGDSTALIIEKTEKQQKPGFSKWQFGITLNAGISGVSKGLNMLSDDKVMFDAYSSAYTPNNSVVSSKPSPIKKRVAFAAGILAKRKLSNRLAVAGGLQYNYYSNQIAVGQLRNQDTVINNMRQAAQFYLNSGIGFKDHVNQFHFVSLPIALEWQLWKKAPLQLQAGLSLQQLVSTNALVFDEGSGVYYSDKNAFRKTQVFSTFGLSYTVLNKKSTSLLIGPLLQYGLTKAEKDNSNHHLFSLGLSAQLFFQKK